MAYVDYRRSCDCDRIYTIRSDGSERAVVLTSESAESARYPQWSPDGSKIAFYGGPSGSHLHVVDADGSDQVDLSGYSPNGVGGQLWDFDWSPDSQSLVFSFGDNYGTVDYEIRSAVFTVRADGSLLRQLTDADHDNRFVAWSPSGDRIAFSSNRDEGTNIYTIEPTGLGLHQLTDAPEGVGNIRSAWAPDESKVFYTRDKGWTAVKSMLPDGSQEKKIQSFKQYGSWDLSPAGTELLILQLDKRSGSYQVFIGRADGTGPLTRITNTPTDKYDANWSPTGRTIAFSAIVPDGQNVFVVSRDGSETHRLTRRHGGIEPDWRPTG
jgi:TolB protein